MITQMAILAGGLASRLGALSEQRPKALMPVCGAPFIDHQLALVRRQGITDVVLCVGRLGEMIEAHVGDGARHELRVRYSYDGPAPLGTGGALRAASSLLDDRFFVEYGDTYLRAPLAEISAAFEAAGTPALMTVYRNENRLDRSNVRFEAGMLMAYDKRDRSPAMRHIDFGLLAFTRAALRHIPPDGAYDLADLLQSLLARGELSAVEVPERFYEIGTPDALAETERLLHPLLSVTHVDRG
jgi:Nucleoside-diphosphate-sugar pyrophosphorylase involved in lipopolysaccharide biosynthesis/translation initiation factor 2B, gamma/epsilon subunits (eIF-2Bgamma/eIF-2Bepsilon)